MGVPAVDRNVAIPYLEVFLEMMSAEVGASPNTLDAYGRDMRDFAAFLRDRGVADPSKAESDDLSAYVEASCRRSLSPSTLSRRSASLRRFYRFLLHEGVRRDNPCQRLPRSRPSRRLPRILSPEEVTRLLERATVPASQTAKGLYRQARLECMMEILYSTGLRVSELVSLPVTAMLAREKRLLPVRGKGDKERLVVLHDRALESVETWLQLRDTHSPAHAASRWLFPTGDGKRHLTRHRFAQLLKELAVRADINPALVSPHVLRHAFASHLLENGADLLSLQKMLGHADISTTQIYTHVLEEQARSLVFNAHPLAKKSISQAK